MGTPDFAGPGLRALIDAVDFDIIAIYTQPDKPVGRKQTLTPPPVKTIALAAGLPVYQPEKIRDETENISDLMPDLIVVIAYGKIIPQTILDIPAYGCVNVHASLLPKYRGAACLQGPILNGDRETGVTIMKMEAGLDTGPILHQEKIDLNDTETLEELHDKLSLIGSQALIPVLKDFCDGKIEPVIQNEAEASYIGLIKKEDGLITPNKSALEIERQIRALNPWPGTYLILPDNEHIKVLAAQATNEKNNRKIGEIYSNVGQLYLACGQNSLHILRLQRENRKALSASDFLKGNKEIIGLIAS